jgi:hypothetical protein
VGIGYLVFAIKMGGVQQQSDLEPLHRNQVEDGPLQVVPGEAIGTYMVAEWKRI